jgi:hypothetical protein
MPLANSSHSENESGFVATVASLLRAVAGKPADIKKAGYISARSISPSFQIIIYLLSDMDNKIVSKRYFLSDSDKASSNGHEFFAISASARCLVRAFDGLD